MNFWKNMPGDRLLADASIWSANFTCLGDDIARVDDFVDLYHFDVSDAHFIPGLLFFPDLIAALRPLTRKPFHIHLMSDNPLSLIDDFVQAGADMITIHCENGPLAADPKTADPKGLGRPLGSLCLQKIGEAGLSAGLALSLDSPPAKVLPYLEWIELVLLMGTPMGIKGQELSALACPRIQGMRLLLKENGFEGKVKIEADGGIRKHTVPALRQSGADVVVMGSLCFKSDDPQQTFAWLHSLP